MANTVSTRLIATDEASSVFAKLNNSMRSSVLQGNLMASAITSGLGAATKGVGALLGGMKEVVGIQQSNIAVAGDFMKLTGQSYGEASEFIDNFSASMAKAAASLPGDTKDYVSLGKSIMDNLIPAFKGLDGVLDEANYSKALEDISKMGALRAATSGTDSALAGLGISKLLGGAGIGELRQLKFFEANPAVLAFVEQEAQKMGKSLKDMTARERAEVLQNALKVPDEVIAASTQSIEGLIQGLKSSLLDPQVGLFGMMRDLDVNTDGNQTVVQATNDLLKKVLSPGGPLSSIRDIFELVGVELGDPMKGLYNAINWTSSKLDELGSFLDSNQAGIAKFVYGAKQSFELLKEAPGKFISQSINSLLRGFNQSRGEGSTDYGSIVGKALAQATNFFATQVLSIVRGMDYGALMVGLFNVGKLVISGIGSFLANLDWQVYMAGGAALLGAALFTTLMASFIPAVGTAFIVVAGGLVAGIAGVLSAPVLLAIAGVGLVIVAAMKHFGVSFQDVMRFVFQAVTGFANPVIAAARLGFNLLRSAITAVIGGITTAFNAVRGLIDRIPGLNVGSSGDIPNAASGFIPDAFRREMNAMPAGASLIAANSSELILNREQQAALLQPRSSSINFGGITINAGSTNNPRELASQVIAEIEARLQQSQMRLA
ncbi:hypothetical protein IQ273_12895 [Nodosilinea sp. LEGE 07298]|uniref:hypothetical protein n=1 Tax=Nodosilinea sp. LEGE 07298 TaxID=2777970 RepID=UPI001881E36A|nr:hypothetical protein [Nodosilinea sp. LEGE 07298]MBE9110310.1 hypothetical protein [Nodosilinea sp. LEGE 07298]